jgi:prefoldin alpha subunit
MNETQKQLQEKVILYQLMQKQLEELSQNAMLIDRKYAEFDLTRQALDDVEGLKEKNEILIPLGSGMFSAGKVTEKKIVTEIGAGILLEKDPASARAFIDEKKKEIEKLAQEMQGEIVGISSSLNSLSNEIEGLSAEARQKGPVSKK